MTARKPDVHIMIDALLSQNRLPRAVQDKAAKLILKLKNDPAANGVNFESIEGARDRHMKSARIDQGHRAIVYDRGGALVVLWMDKHDDAYRWARDRIIDINPLTASVQVTDMSLVEAPRTPAVVASTSRARFADYSDADLIAVGVPEALLPAIRVIQTDEELEANKPGIPADAYDALICLAVGYSVEETLEELERTSGPSISTDDFAAALKTPESQRSFWFVEGDQELQKVLDEPLEFWRVFLHPSQRKLVNRQWNGPVLVRGGAGTGKTVVGMHRARYLADRLIAAKDALGKILFTTFTSNLAADVKANLANLCSQEEMDRIEVIHLDGWVTDFLRRQGYQREILYGEAPRLQDAWDAAFRAHGKDIGLTLEFLRDEWRQVVQANGISDLPGYLRVQRTGRGTSIDRKTKEKVWAVFAAYRARLDEEELSEAEDAYRHAREILRAKPALLPYRAIVVDEAQDLGAEAFRLIAEIAPKADGVAGPHSMFIVGDAHQRIYGRRASMTKCGINVRGRSRKLRICYRTSDEIRRFAEAIVQGVTVDDLDESTDDLTGYRSLFHGPKPDIAICSSSEEEMTALIEWIERCKADGIEESEICVLARTNDLVTAAANGLKARGFKVNLLARKKADDRAKPGLRLGTMHRAKGLEFAAIAIVDVNDGVVPPRRILDAAPDAAIRRQVVEADKALLHVSATRAKTRLFVASSGDQSELLPKVAAGQQAKAA
ncbi:UvrD-helicase domain-containing protein [Microvirga arabica]|uniref:UvrD-helicase domain-containing protein n=1 Tax=Microvirga arabica TaxID=1128671 RepID=UPI00193A09F4|nr:UvrD-helicase domain-containing protein [Microvirga arabica]MBM1170204.1 DEAD/DEAH box helicase [Microvirga arabica]